MKFRKLHGNEGGWHTVNELEIDIAEAHVASRSTCAVKHIASVHHAIVLTDCESRPKQWKILRNGADSRTCVTRKSQIITMMV